MDTHVSTRVFGVDVNFDNLKIVALVRILHTLKSPSFQVGKCEVFPSLLVAFILGLTIEIGVS